MASKAFIVMCVSFFMQAACSQYLGRIGAGPLASLASPLTGPLTSLGGGLAAPLLGPLGAPGLSALAYDCGVASSGGSFPVTSASPIAPIGVSVVSENAIEGALAVGGNLPLLGSVAVEGAFPTAGAGAVSYGCGNNAVLIETERPITTGILAPGAVGPAPVLGAVSGLAPGRIGSFAPGLGLGRRGLGCGCGYY